MLFSWALDAVNMSQLQGAFNASFRFVFGLHKYDSISRIEMGARPNIKRPKIKRPNIKRPEVKRPEVKNL